MVLTDTQLESLVAKSVDVVEGTDQEIKTKETAGEFSARKTVEDRSKISMWVFGTYMGAIFGLVLYVFIVGLLLYLSFSALKGAAVPANFEKGMDILKIPAEIIAEVIKTAILPIVTLVIGFYFGTEKIKPRKNLKGDK